MRHGSGTHPNVEKHDVRMGHPAIKDKTSEELVETKRKISELQGQIVVLEESLKSAKSTH